MGQDPTTFEAWSGSNIGGPAHRTKFWQGEKISNRRFCHVSWHVGHYISFQSIKCQTCFPRRTVDSPCTLFTFTYLLRCVTYSQKTAMTSCSHLASSTNLHSLQTGYWSSDNYYCIVCSLAGVSSPPRDSLLPASSVFYLMMSVNLNIIKHINIATTIY